MFVLTVRPPRIANIIYTCTNTIHNTCIYTYSKSKKQTNKKQTIEQLFRNLNVLVVYHMIVFSIVCKKKEHIFNQSVDSDHSGLVHEGNMSDVIHVFIF